MAGQPPDRAAARDQLAPETTIGVAALFIAVAGLARTIGGFAAAVTAAAIGAAIACLRRCHRKIGSQAQTTTFVSLIDVSGSDAQAHTVQSLYQPVFDFKNGKWVPHPLPPASLSFSMPDQLYLLRRVGGHWKVQ